MPPVPAAAIRHIIEREFGAPVASVFAEFDDEPLATASIGQVHAARLASGEDVAVKVQEPGVAEQIDIDLRLLLDVARVAQQRSPLGRDYDLVALAEGFARTLRGELDYEREGRNADAFRRQFAGSRDVVIPKIYWPRSTRRVLTMQRLSGVMIDDLERLDRLGIDRHDIAVRSANLILSEIFEHGVFHADPHPGNVLVLEGGAIGALVRDVEHLLDRYVGRPLAALRMEEVTADVFAVMRRHRLRKPEYLALLLKTLAMNEGVGRRLDPGFNATAVAAPFVRRAMRQRLNPGAWEPELHRGLIDLARVGLDLPGGMRRLACQLNRGELTVDLRPQGLDEPLHRLEAMINRLAMSIMLAAFAVSSAVLMTVYHPGGQQTWLGWFLALGLLAATVIGPWMLAAIWRSRRR